MTTMFRFICSMLPLLYIVAFSGAAWGDQGKELFDKQCASCHTIGGGDSGGPDLKGITAKRPHEWLERVIVEPEKLTAEKDATQAELVKKFGFEMPNLKISRDNAKVLVAYLEAAGSSAGAASPAPAKAALAVTPELIAAGKALFTGERSFSKGGAPCVACHAFVYPDVQGANLASDLTQMYEGMGEQGLRGALKSLKFPIMKKIYDDRPLSDEEASALIAFMKDAGDRKGAAAGKSALATGAALFVCIIIALTLWKRRIG